MSANPNANFQQPGQMPAGPMGQAGGFGHPSGHNPIISPGAAKKKGSPVGRIVMVVFLLLLLGGGGYGGWWWFTNNISSTSTADNDDKTGSNNKKKSPKVMFPVEYLVDGPSLAYSISIRELANSDLKDELVKQFPGVDLSTVNTLFVSRGGWQNVFILELNKSISDEELCKNLEIEPGKNDEQFTIYHKDRYHYSVTGNKYVLVSRDRGQLHNILRRDGKIPNLSENMRTALKRADFGKPISLAMTANYPVDFIIGEGTIKNSDIHLAANIHMRKSKTKFDTDGLIENIIRRQIPNEIRDKVTQTGTSLNKRVVTARIKFHGVPLLTYSNPQLAMILKPLPLAKKGKVEPTPKVQTYTVTKEDPGTWNQTLNAGDKYVCTLVSAENIEGEVVVTSNEALKKDHVKCISESGLPVSYVDTKDIKKFHFKWKTKSPEKIIVEIENEDKNPVSLAFNYKESEVKVVKNDIKNPPAQRKSPGAWNVTITSQQTRTYEVQPKANCRAVLDFNVLTTKTDLDVKIYDGKDLVASKIVQDNGIVDWQSEGKPYLVKIKNRRTNKAFFFRVTFKEETAAPEVVAGVELPNYGGILGSQAKYMVNNPIAVVYLEPKKIFASKSFSHLKSIPGINLEELTSTSTMGIPPTDMNAMFISGRQKDSDVVIVVYTNSDYTPEAILKNIKYKQKDLITIGDKKVYVLSSNKTFTMINSRNFIFGEMEGFREIFNRKGNPKTSKELSDLLATFAFDGNTVAGVVDFKAIAKDAPNMSPFPMVGIEDPQFITVEGKIGDKIDLKARLRFKENKSVTIAANRAQQLLMPFITSKELPSEITDVAKSIKFIELGNDLKAQVGFDPGPIIQAIMKNPERIAKALPGLVPGPGPIPEPGTEPTPVVGDPEPKGDYKTPGQSWKIKIKPKEIQTFTLRSSRSGLSTMVISGAKATSFKAEILHEKKSIGTSSKLLSAISRAVYFNIEGDNNYVFKLTNRSDVITGLLTLRFTQGGSGGVPPIKGVTKRPSVWTAPVGKNSSLVYYFTPTEDSEAELIANGFVFRLPIRIRVYEAAGRNQIADGEGDQMAHVKWFATKGTTYRVVVQNRSLFKRNQFRIQYKEKSAALSAKKSPASWNTPIDGRQDLYFLLKSDINGKAKVAIKWDNSSFTRGELYDGNKRIGTQVRGARVPTIAWKTEKGKIYRLKLHHGWSRKNAVAINYINSPINYVLKEDGSITRGKENPYKIQLKANRTYTIDLESEKFDAQLRLKDPFGNEVAMDEDSGEGFNAQISYTPRQPGEYTIIARSSANGGQGEYSLSVMEE